MKKTKTVKGKATDSATKADELTSQELRARLDAVVMLLCLQQFGDEDGDLDRGRAAKLLHKAGYKPLEIAKIFGKKKATDVSGYLYRYPKQFE
jgi:hypothetical protein